MPTGQTWRRGAWVLVVLLAVVGLGSRVAPLFDQGGRLLRQWPSEDGYLMLTIARNIALGRGMSVSAGTIDTNGTQPLFSFVEAAAFAAVGGDRSSGVAIVLALQTFLGVAAAGLLFLLARGVLAERSYRAEAAGLCAALWFASASCIPHTMNCLETGLYAMLVLACLVAWHRQETRGGTRERVDWSTLWIGVLLGLTFWARNDAVFLIAALTGVHTALGLPQWRRQLRRRAVESGTMGLVSVFMAAPWMINNKIRFGSIVPISGPAQTESVVIGDNLVEVPSKLFEQASIVLPVPEVLETTTAAVVCTSVFAALYFVALGTASRHARRGERCLLAVGVSFAALLVGYYGLFFGASHFVGRYLFPLSPLLALASVTLVGVGLARLWGSSMVRAATLVAGLALLALTLGLNVRLYARGRDHMHFQVVEWVGRNVGEETWVGAIQSGTLGFFHDRTVNLDGKVNPQALAARMGRGIPLYVVSQEFDEEGGRIEYLADWSGIAAWVDLDPIAEHFQLIVDDRARNLAVLARR